MWKGSVINKKAYMLQALERAITVKWSSNGSRAMKTLHIFAASCRTLEHNASNMAVYCNLVNMHLGGVFLFYLQESVFRGFSVDNGERLAAI